MGNEDQSRREDFSKLFDAISKMEGIASIITAAGKSTAPPVEEAVDTQEKCDVEPVNRLVFVDMGGKSFLATTNDTGEVFDFMPTTDGALLKRTFANYIEREMLGTLSDIHAAGGAGFMVTELSPEQENILLDIVAIRDRAVKNALRYVHVDIFRKLLGEA